MSKKLEDFSLVEICIYLADMFSIEVIAKELSDAFWDRGEKCKKHNKVMHDAYKRDSFILDDVAKGEVKNEY